MEMTRTEFQPFPVGSGIQTMNGKEYMADAKGALVPVEVIKPQHKLEDETVRKVMGFAIAMSQQIERFKEHCMADVCDLDAVLEQEYGFIKQGNKGKGNRTYMTHDGLMRVQVQVADRIDFGPELQIAKQLVDECLNEWASEAVPQLRAVVTKAFNTDKQGQINRSEIFTLLRHNFTDTRWMRAMDAIRDSMRVVGSKEYIRFGMRNSPNADWQSVTIDLAKA